MSFDNLIARLHEVKAWQVTGKMPTEGALVDLAQTMPNEGDLRQAAVKTYSDLAELFMSGKLDACRVPDLAWVTTDDEIFAETPFGAYRIKLPKIQRVELLANYGAPSSLVLWKAFDGLGESPDFLKEKAQADYHRRCVSVFSGDIF